MGRISSILGALRVPYERITVEELREMLDSSIHLTILDIRTSAEHDLGRIPGSILLSPNNLRCMEKHYWEGKVLIYCTAGLRSYWTARRFASRGIDISDLTGGFIAWEDAGGEIERG